MINSDKQEEKEEGGEGNGAAEGSAWSLVLFTEWLKTCRVKLLWFHGESGSLSAGTAAAGARDCGKTLEGRAKCC